MVAVAITIAALRVEPITALLLSESGDMGWDERAFDQLHCRRADALGVGEYGGGQMRRGGDPHVR
jgi:hypothetical protein